MNAIADGIQVQENIREIVFEAIDELNQEIPQEKQLEKTADTPLLSKSGKIDSLGLVRLIVAIEQKIEEIFGDAIMLADEKAFAQKDSPFKTVGTLINYIFMLLGADLDE
jgi:D-alanine--poly(phosphoribitol) ligase subunit 2